MRLGIRLGIPQKLPRGILLQDSKPSDSQTDEVLTEAHVTEWANIPSGPKV